MVLLMVVQYAAAWVKSRQSERSLVLCHMEERGTAKIGCRREVDGMVDLEGKRGSIRLRQVAQAE